MAFFVARLTAKDGDIVAENVRVWLNTFRQGRQMRWDGSFELPATQLTSYRSTYNLDLEDGRSGEIINLNTVVYGDNILVYFEGRGPLRYRTPPQRRREAPEHCRTPKTYL